MNKWRLYIATAFLFGIAGYIAYKLYFPDLVAKTITDRYDFLIPDRYLNEIEKLTDPLNNGATKAVAEIHRAGVTIDQVLLAIDKAEEEQVVALLNELNETGTSDPDEVFDLVKKHFPADFDMEVFRESFTKKLTSQDIRNGIRLANHYHARGDIDPAVVKSILKRILIQKEAEFNQIIETE